MAASGGNRRPSTARRPASLIRANRSRAAPPVPPQHVSGIFGDTDDAPESGPKKVEHEQGLMPWDCGS